MTQNIALPTPALEPRIDRAIQAVNRMLDPLARRLKLSADAQTGALSVALVAQGNGATLRHIAPEEMRALARAIDHVGGLLVRETA